MNTSTVFREVHDGLSDGLYCGLHDGLFNGLFDGLYDGRCVGLYDERYGEFHFGLRDAISKFLRAKLENQS